MPTPRELAKLLWPEFGTVFLGGFVFSVCVIMFALVACLSAARTTLFKAKLAEVTAAIAALGEAHRGRTVRLVRCQPVARARELVLPLGEPGHRSGGQVSGHATP